MLSMQIFCAGTKGCMYSFWRSASGLRPPVIIKYPFWQMTNDNKNAVYACLNYNEAVCPVQIEERSIVIDGDSGAVIKQLLYISVFYRESRIDSSMGRGW